MKLKPVKIDCPHIDNQREIVLAQQQVNVVGETTPQYKTMNFQCSDKENCNFIDERGMCPPYRSIFGIKKPI